MRKLKTGHESEWEAIDKLLREISVWYFAHSDDDGKRNLRKKRKLLAKNLADCILQLAHYHTVRTQIRKNAD